MNAFRRGRAGAIAAAVLAAAVALGGCNYTEYFQKSNQDYGSRQPGDPKMSRAVSHGPTASDVPRKDRHDNRYFTYSSRLSYEISRLPGVAGAIVMLTDKNAYVGLLTDGSATGTKSRGGSDTFEQDNTGTTEGVYNVDTGDNTWDNREMATPYNSFFTHRRISDLSTELRQVIGDTIRRRHPELREAHISANREFVNQLVEYAKAAWSGRPLAPLVPQFNKLMNYTFGGGTEIPLRPNWQNAGE